MQKNKIIAIGDIHGCRASLDALLEKLEPYKDYTYVFVGDYIDRGPDSKGVIDRLLKLNNEHECIFLRGNHELMLLNAINQNDSMMWMKNGGEQTLASYQTTQAEMQLPEAHLNFFSNTLLYYDTADYFFVHAGVPPEKTIAACLEDQSEEVVDHFLWGRSHLNSFGTPWEKTVVFGHTPRSHPIRKPNMIGIDTGCVYDRLGYGKLTAVILPDTEFVKQISLDN